MLLNSLRVLLYQLLESRRKAIDLAQQYQVELRRWKGKRSLKIGKLLIDDNKLRDTNYHYAIIAKITAPSCRCAGP